ncbi:MAG: hypothetical protein ABI597_03540 [Gammaproteobacteria bacterium]
MSSARMAGDIILDDGPANLNHYIKVLDQPDRVSDSLHEEKKQDHNDKRHQHQIAIMKILRASSFGAANVFVSNLVWQLVDYSRATSLGNYYGLHFIVEGVVSNLLASPFTLYENLVYVPNRQISRMFTVKSTAIDMVFDSINQPALDFSQALSCLVTNKNSSEFNFVQYADSSFGAYEVAFVATTFSMLAMPYYCMSRYAGLKLQKSELMSIALQNFLAYFLDSKLSPELDPIEKGLSNTFLQGLILMSISLLMNLDLYLELFSYCQNKPDETDTNEAIASASAMFLAEEQKNSLNESFLPASPDSSGDINFNGNVEVDSPPRASFCDKVKSYFQCNVSQFSFLNRKKPIAAAAALTDSLDISENADFVLK